MAVISGASRARCAAAAGRRSVSIASSPMQVATVSPTSAISSSSQPGQAGPAIAVTIGLQRHGAPTISTSPWAKLIRLMMPYTIV